MRNRAIVLASVVVLSAAHGCTPAEPPAVASASRSMSFHYMDDVGNCSLHFSLKDYRQYRQISDELDRICKPDVSTCRGWMAKRAAVGPPAKDPRSTRILERSLHHHLVKAAASADSWWLDVPEKNELAAWMDHYCRAHPKHPTVRGARRFVADQTEAEKREKLEQREAAQ